MAGLRPSGLSFLQGLSKAVSGQWPDTAFPFAPFRPLYLTFP